MGDTEFYFKSSHNLVCPYLCVCVGGREALNQFLQYHSVLRWRSCLLSYMYFLFTSTIFSHALCASHAQNHHEFCLFHMGKI